MQRFKEMLNFLPYYELLKLKDDIKQNKAEKILKIIEEKILEIETNENKVCVICGKELYSNDEIAFSLIFGPKGLKKKANFCARDCLEYFLNSIKKVKNE